MSANIEPLLNSWNGVSEQKRTWYNVGRNRVTQSASTKEGFSTPSLFTDPFEVEEEAFKLPLNDSDGSGLMVSSG